MSKLYNALERLEQIAAEQSEDSDTLEALSQAEPVRRGSGFPRRALMVSLALLLLGLLVLAAIVWWQHGSDLFGLTFRKAGKAVPAETATPLPAPPSPAAVATVPPAPLDDSAAASSSPDTSVPPHEGTAPVTEETSRATPRNVSPTHTDSRKTGPEVATVQAGARKAENGKQAEGKTGSRSAKNGEGQEVNPGDARVRKIAAEAQTARLSRWLLQAEQRRKEQDWSGAARLYRLVWEHTGNPAVANNLAASLIRLGKTREAVSVLKKALQVAPGDKDLLLNLELATKAGQERKRKQ